jgi:hypothetical protein
VRFLVLLIHMLRGRMPIRGWEFSVIHHVTIDITHAFKIHEGTRW